MYVRHEVSEARSETVAAVLQHRDDPFAELARRVAADPHNPYNPRWGALFDRWQSYVGDAARGLPRRCCSRSCRNRTHEARRRERWGSELRWGSAA